MVEPVRRFAGRLGAGPSDVEAVERDAIAAVWARHAAANPKLFNGRVMLADDASLADGTLAVRYRDVAFATFLWLREQPAAEQRLRNVFGAAAVVSSDGAVLLGRMARHTANAGKVYFPAGTPDHDDLVGDVVDVEGSIVRELAEETGLGPPLVRPTDLAFAVAGVHLTAYLRRFDTDLDAAALQAAALRSLAAEREPELDGVVLARSAADLTAASPDYVHAALPYLLGTTAFPR